MSIVKSVVNALTKDGRGICGIEMADSEGFVEEAVFICPRSLQVRPGDVVEIKDPEVDAKGFARGGCRLAKLQDKSKSKSTKSTQDYNKGIDG